MRFSSSDPGSHLIDIYDGTGKYLSGILDVDTELGEVTEFARDAEGHFLHDCEGNFIKHTYKPPGGVHVEVRESK